MLNDTLENWALLSFSSAAFAFVFALAGKLEGTRLLRTLKRHLRRLL